MKIDNFTIPDISGQKGGKQHTPVEAANTLRSSAVVKAVEIISEGPIVGLMGGARGIKLNGTPLGNADGSVNFQRVKWDWRDGTPDQTYMPGFEGASAEFSVNSDVTIATSVTRTTSSADVDAMTVTVALPNGLYKSETNGDVNGTSVSFTIEKRLGSGTWEVAVSATIDGKTVSTYERMYRIERPVGTGVWSVKVTRVTPDAENSSIQNALKFARYTEVQDLKLPYANSAVVGIAADAESFGNAVPLRSYIVKGLIVQVPTNFNPEGTGERFSGIWDGTFVDAWTNDPAWVLYACLTNTRWGMGQYGITADDIDVYSFYAASVYNNELVDITYGTDSAQERRYRFNAVLNSDIDCVKLVQYVCGSMRASLTYSGGLFQLVQDSPKDVSLLINKSNMIADSLYYKSSGLFERHTEFQVIYNDKTDGFLQRTITFPSDDDETDLADECRAAQERYGYNPIELSAFGATSPGQAMRYARWAFDTENRQTEIACWQASYDNFFLKVGMVVELFDEDYARQAGAGRIVSVNGTTVVLDRGVPIVSGSKIKLTMSDGTIQERNITQTSGTISTVTVNAAFTGTVQPQAIYQVHAAIAPRPFKVIGITETEKNILEVTAVFYDSSKYERVENDISIPAQLFSAPDLNRVGEVSDITFKGQTIVQGTTVMRSLNVSWTPPTGSLVSHYEMHWRQALGTWNKVYDISAPSTEIRGITEREINVVVFAIGGGKTSRGTAATYNFSSADGISNLYPVTNLYAVATGGTLFVEDDLVVRFTNPEINSGIEGAGTNDFQIEVKDEDTVLRTDYVPGVAPGSNQEYTYSYEDNLHDGGPRRTVTISVRIRDTNFQFTDETAVDFTNPPPGIPLDIQVQPGFESTKITYQPPPQPDYEGTLIWASNKYPYELNEQSLIFDGTDTYFAHNSLSGGETYYYRFATYDGFAKDFTGASLNLSAVFTTSPYSTDFDNNKLRNSGFEARQAANRPTYWRAYNNAGVSVGYTTPAGRNTPLAYGLKANATGATSFGLMPLPSETPDGNGVVGGWKPNTTYTISFYAKKLNGASWTTMALAWNTAPSTSTDVINPELTVEFQRYVFKITWGGAVESLGNLFVRVVGSTAIDDELIVDDIQVEARDQVTEYQPRIDEIVAVQAINVTGQLQDAQLAAISATKLTGTVTDAQIAGLSASKITGTITSNQIQSLDAAKLVGTLSNAQLDALNIDLSTLGGKITATQITDGAVQTPHLAASSVVADKIAAGAVIAGKIAAGSIVAGDIASQAITTEKLSTGAVTTAKLAAGSVLADNIASGAITTGKLLVTGQGKALNDDPSCVDASAWSVGQGTFVIQADATVPMGTHSVRTTNGTQLMSRYFPVEAGKTYKTALYAKQVSGGGTIYVRTYFYDAAGNVINYVVNGVSPILGPLEGLAVPITWTRYNGSSTPSAGAVNARILLHTNWNTTGVTDLTDIRCEEFVGADLIVDGSINASKLVAGSVTTTQLATGSVIANTIAAGAISASKIQAGTITASQIAAGSITGDRLLANTITGDKIAAGTITANKIATGTITAASAVIAAAAIDTLMLKNGAVTDIKTVSAQGNSPNITIGLAWPGNSASGASYSWTLETPTWVVATPPGVSGPFASNIFVNIQSPRPQMLETSIDIGLQAILQRYTGTWTNVAASFVTRHLGMYPEPNGTVATGDSSESFQIYANLVAGGTYRVQFSYDLSQYIYTRRGTSTGSFSQNYNAVIISQLR